MVFVLFLLTEESIAENYFQCNSPSGEMLNLSITENYNIELENIIKSNVCEGAPPKGSFVLYDFDKIEKEIVFELFERHKLAQINVKYIILDSFGGDIDYAMEIGEKIYEAGWTVIVPNWGKCYSACVLTYIGGKHRLHFGDLGIHRPRFTSNDLNISSEDFARKYKPVFDRIGSYLDKYLVSSYVLELMRSTPSSQMRILTEREIVDFGLGSNILAEEIKRQRLVRGCGESYTNDYYEAERQVRQVCNQNVDINDSAGVGSMSDCIRNVFRRRGVELAPSCIAK